MAVLCGSDYKAALQKAFHKGDHQEERAQNPSAPLPQYGKKLVAKKAVNTVPVKV
jgi:hypothetical protein